MIIDVNIARHINDDEDMEDEKSIKGAIEEYLKTVPLKGRPETREDILLEYGLVSEADIICLRDMVRLLSDKIKKSSNKDVECDVPYIFMQYEELKAEDLFVFLSDGKIRAIMTIPEIIADYRYYLETNRSVIDWIDSCYQIIEVYRIKRSK